MNIIRRDRAGADQLPSSGLKIEAAREFTSTL